MQTNNLNPLISIITIIYNKKYDLQRTVENISNLTHKYIEHIDKLDFFTKGKILIKLRKILSIKEMLNAYLLNTEVKMR